VNNNTFDAMVMAANAPMVAFLRSKLGFGALRSTTGFVGGTVLEKEKEEDDST
jgi:hypothetical protein